MKKIIVANWKMNPQNLKEARRIFSNIEKAASKMLNVETIICLPFVYISSLKSQVSSLKIGAQDVFWGDKGAYTGEISASMLKNLGVQYVIVGHSEERQDHPEEINKIINKKISQALKNNLKIILCVGEKKRDSKRKYLSFIKKEIIEGLKGIDKRDANNIIIAYEPIWAIGEKAVKSDKPEDLYNIVFFIRKTLSSFLNKDTAENIPILYGGSVNVDNAYNFLKNGGVQGLLVGRSSLEEKIFSKILKDANI